jgi:EAL domain-containing protein (putative c-di-GMP-specific phosphodiesterase class I)
VLNLDLEDFRLEPMEEEAHSRFSSLLLRSEFQPIFDTGNARGLLGYEALLRPSTGIETVSPQFAFMMADSLGKLVKFDRMAMSLHMLNYNSLSADKGLLFLNAHPKFLVSVTAPGKVFEYMVNIHSLPAQQVVIEILEHAVETDKQLIGAVDNCLARGFKIAIDDFGSKHSNLDRLWKVSPHYVKLDLAIIQLAETDGKVRRVLPKLIEIVHALGARAIVEGIENEVQLNIAMDAGAKLLQGYFLGKPATAQCWQKAKLPPPHDPVMSGATQPHGRMQSGR